ncbi:MAG: DUF2752 domain-containing protein [Saprospiraceae bacterium]
MPRANSKIYLVLALACMGGYAWLYLNLSMPDAVSGSDVEMCPIKRLTGVPCPSCGSTRSVVSLLRGNVAEAVYWNPLGFVMVLGLFVSPIWMAYDYFKKEQTLLVFYEKTEAFLKKKNAAWAFALLILLNWIWNIIKHL